MADRALLARQRLEAVHVPANAEVRARGVGGRRQGEHGDGDEERAAHQTEPLRRPERDGEADRAHGEEPGHADEAGPAVDRVAAAEAREREYSERASDEAAEVAADRDPGNRRR